MTTNGQILTERNIQKLLGRRVYLYVSLDAATRETYARLRNDTFDNILRNLRRLITAKGGPGQLPHVYVVFMPMRANVHELEAFVRLSADLAVDKLVLRPLNYSDSIDLDWKRAGYHFQYQRELLPFSELVRVSGRAAELCARLGVPLSDQMDFGGMMQDLFTEGFEEGRRSVGVSVPEPAEADRREPEAPVSLPRARSDDGAPIAGEASATPPPHDTTRASDLDPAVSEEKEAPPAGTTAVPSLGEGHSPACLEPWKSLYILRRGVFPCCYGGGPIAAANEYHRAWNSPTMQAIRAELLRGRFHSYCLRSPACPIVRKAQQASRLPLTQVVRLKATQLYLWADRVSQRKIGTLYREARWWPGWLTTRMARAATDPRYVIRHSRRLVSKALGRAAAP
jgi:hypothetical protein